MNNYLEILKVQFSFLVFRKIKPNLEKHQKEYFVMILFFTTIAVLVDIGITLKPIGGNTWV